MLKELWITLVLLLIIVLYITLPVSHRAVIHIADSHHVLVSDKSSSSSSKKTSSSSSSSSLSLLSSTSSTSTEASTTTFAPVVHPQMQPTDFIPSQQYHNPYSPIKKSSRPCNSLKYTTGRWVRRKKQRNIPLYPALGEILGCCERGFIANRSARRKEQQHHGHRSEEEEEKEEMREELFYDWVPDECDLIPWSEEMFCKSLKGRDLMIAGDSLNDHWHASLYYLLGGKRDIYIKEGTIASKKRCKGHDICSRFYKKPLKLHFLTNQFLAEQSLRNRNYKWWKPIRKYPILILNSGSWMRDPANEARVVPDSRWQQYMIKALGLVKRQQYNGTIIWRTTYAGHPDCWNYSGPLEKPLSAEQYPDIHPYNKYRWEFISERNNFTTNLWTDAGAHILDVERLTNMMPLGHLGKNHPKFAAKNATDCLHYCSPGAVYDTWSVLLMNLLLGNL